MDERRRMAEYIHRANGLMAAGTPIISSAARRREAIEQPALHPLRKAWKWAKAVVPWYLGVRTGRTVTVQRRQTCLACEFAVQGQSRPGLFCTKCGCPETQSSALSRKTTMRWLQCPIGKWPLGLAS